MELVTNEEFLAWAAEHGVCRNPAHPSQLVFDPPRGDFRFWSTWFEYDYATLELLTLVLDTMDDWRSCWVHKRMGGWTYSHDECPDVSDHRLDAITRWTGIPKDFTGSVRYDEPDRANLMMLMMLVRHFGSDTDYDFFFVPDHAQQFLLLNHDGVIFVSFADPSKIDPFVEHLASFGFALPAWPCPPFTRKLWMKETTAKSVADAYISEGC